MNIIAKKSAVLSVVLAGAVLMAGCGKKSATPVAEKGIKAEGAPEEIAEEQADPGHQLLLRIEALLDDGDTDGAIALAEEGLNDADLHEARQTIFGTLVRILVGNERLDSAKERMLEAFQNDSELAMGGFGVVYSALQEQGDLTNAAAWTEQVLAIDILDAAARNQMRERNVMSYIGLDDTAKVVALAQQLVQDAPSGGALDILSRSFDMMFNQDKLEIMEAVLAKIGQVVTSDQGTQNLIMSSRIRLHAYRKEWQRVTGAMPLAIVKLPDNQLHRLLRQVFMQAIKDKEYESIETICTSVIATHDGKEQSFVLAGRQWIEVGMRVEPTVLPDRIANLQDAGYPVRNLASILMRYFYEMIDMTETIDAMKTLASRFSLLVDNENMRNSLKTMALDASFVAEDYDTALETLTQGIAGHDASWHAMAISKVRAHKALKEGKSRDAVKYFREFMGTLAAAKELEPTIDPVTGVEHSREMIMGRNAKRIGDILKEIPDADAAKEAYNEARSYYQKALASERDPEAVKIINQDLAEVP